jgi:peptidoglycan/xylan/chitin deacetylase (PgdA/CDA1 family)
MSGTLHLLVGIDTEGDNQWDAASRERQTFENVHALERLHACFERHGVRPTYLVTHPVVTDAQSAAVLSRLLSRGNCEIGAHHHAWETPPFSPEDARRHLYALALPLAQFEEQLQALTAAIEDRVGVRPVSYRSGRFGFSARHVSALERAGYLVESSVAPLFFEAHKHGPDFVGAPATPYYLAYDDARNPGASGVLEVPVSAGLNRRVPRWLERAYGRVPRPYTTKRVLRKLGIARVMWLRPSYSPLSDMKALAQRLAADGTPQLNVLFHSSEAIAGASPYNRTEQDLAVFFEKLDAFLGFAVDELGAVPATLREFGAEYGK